MDILEIIILGLVQAITEWLPLSSKTMDTLVYTALFEGSPANVVSMLLYLHFGTLIAAAIYFRKEVLSIIREFASSPKNIGLHKKSYTGFLFTAVAITGIVGIPLLLLELYFLPGLEAGALLSIMGAGLVLTGFLLSSQQNKRWRTADLVTWKDGILTGALQGLSVLPGVSRAGTTTTALIWRGFNAESAFRLSFLLSIPTIFAAEILIWAAEPGTATLSLADGLALAISSFVFGYLTIDVLIKIAHKINVASLAFAFGIMMLAFGIIGIG